jgi:CubicO group peptidase (beta-lactamase class C family)
MKELIKEIESCVKEVNFSGVISIFRESETIFHSAFGYRDIKNKIPNNTETKFAIASGTKLFTALGIGRLIEQGKLSLDTKVTETHMDFISFIDKNATILNLLTHTSGIYDYYDEEIIKDFENFTVAKKRGQIFF